MLTIKVVAGAALVTPLRLTQLPVKGLAVLMVILFTVITSPPTKTLVVQPISLMPMTQQPRQEVAVALVVGGMALTVYV